MRIVIDMQGAQTISRYRGIGRYVRSFTAAVLRNRGSHEIILLFNADLHESLAGLLEIFGSQLQAHQIAFWRSPQRLLQERAYESLPVVSQMIREAAIEQLRPDIVHITSIFEDDGAVHSIGRFDKLTLTSVTLYDLVPMLNPKQYLSSSPRYTQRYNERLEYLKKADLLLAISESARQEAITHLHLEPDHVRNVSTAIDDHFVKVSIDPGYARQFLGRFGIVRPYVFYAGGADDRKNLPRLIQAYARLSGEIRQTHQLVLGGKIHPDSENHLRNIARSAELADDELVFTRQISDQDLVRLYNLGRLFVFPSWHEGFGLPALEAMACGLPVIGSNTSSVPEVIGMSEALFDPMQVEEIARKMHQGLLDEAFRQRLLEHAAHQVGKFSWDQTARAAIAGWEELFSRKGQKTSRPQTWEPRNRLRQMRYQQLVQELAKVIGQLPKSRTRPCLQQDLQSIAISIGYNERSLDWYARFSDLPRKDPDAPLVWRIEGPFDSSYSLALENRELARALHALGHEVVLHSTEGPGDFEPDPQFLADNADLAVLHARSVQTPPRIPDVTSRNLYPPRVQDMECHINLLTTYGWEESRFPQHWVDQFNEKLQGILVISEHVRKVLIDSGVRVPVGVSSLGVDHWQRITSDPDYQLKVSGFRFLHVSSCFPRKGVEPMLEAFGRAFAGRDDVCLVIKTFANPHNQIHQWLEDVRGRFDAYPAVHVIEQDLPDAQLKALYEQCQALVAPSCAEGFGLPLAEAMLSGLPVITTAWSGQLDFCNPDTAWMVDYEFEHARTHFNQLDSVWARPHVESLAQAMLAVRQATDTELRERAQRALTHLMSRHTWRAVAQRSQAFVCHLQQRRPNRTPRIGWISSWQTRCGIAAYSEHLVAAMHDSVITVLASHARDATSQPQDNVYRCWHQHDDEPLGELRHQIQLHQLDTLVIQFNYGFFGFDHLASFIEDMTTQGKTLVVEMHSTTDPLTQPHKQLGRLVAALSRCDRILVHTPADLNRLKSLGLSSNVALFPLAVFQPRTRSADKHAARLNRSASQASDRSADQNPDQNPFVIASYGFFLPHKGLLELIEAVGELIERGLNVHLDMVNAQYPVQESADLISQAYKLVAMKGLLDQVTICTEFLTDEQCLVRLGQSDLVVFPYQVTGESSSAAVRHGIASATPVAVTPLEIFRDVGMAVHQLPGTTPSEMANGIETLMRAIQSGDRMISETQQNARQWCETHRYSVLGRRLGDMIIALHNPVPDLMGTADPQPSHCNREEPQ